MLVTNRFVVEEDVAASFTERAHAALAALAARPGYLRGRAAAGPRRPEALVPDHRVGVGRAPTGGRWAAFDVKIHATPLLAESLDEPSAYETLASADPDGEVEVAQSDRAADPGR